MKRILLALGMTAFLSAAACRLSLPGGSGDEDQADTGRRYPGLSAASLGPHRSRFGLQFDGDKAWSYRLETAHGSSAVSHELKIDGVPLSVSPGDVRLIIEDSQVRMSGQATLGACWLFPEKSELQRSFLTPDSVFQPGEITLHLENEDDRVAGRQSARYAVTIGTSDRWQEIEGDLWLDASSGAVLRFQFSARGQDPFFDFGAGRMEGDYSVLELGVQDLEPIDGCEIPYPVPEDAREIVLLEDYLAFETDLSEPELARFYQSRLEAGGWNLIEGPVEGQFGTTMTFSQGDRLAEVSARDGDDGTKLEIFSESAD